MVPRGLADNFWVRKAPLSLLLLYVGTHNW
jgi:hypothetical protein